MTQELGRKEDDDGLMILTGHIEKGRKHTFSGTFTQPGEPPFDFTISIRMGEEWTDGCEVIAGSEKMPKDFYEIFDEQERADFLNDLAITAMEIVF